MLTHTYMQSCYRLFSIIFASSLLVACGGGGSGSTQTETVQQGEFIDAAVANLRFETATQSGLTDANGTFSYLAGEVVSFFIGDILIGSATGAETITPINLVSGASGATDPEVTNILRFIQSLDADANLDNGIQISDAVINALAGQTLDFSLDNSAFEAAFSALSSSVLGSVSLVTIADARNHLIETLNAVTPGQNESLTITGTDTGVIGTSFTPNPIITIPPSGATSGPDLVQWNQILNNATGVAVDIIFLDGEILGVTFTYLTTNDTGNVYGVACDGSQLLDFVVGDCSGMSVDMQADQATFAITLSPFAEDDLTGATAPITLNGILSWSQF